MHAAGPECLMMALPQTADDIDSEFPFSHGRDCGPVRCRLARHGTRGYSERRPENEDRLCQPRPNCSRGGITCSCRMTARQRNWFGEVVEMSSPYPRHGQICSRIDRIIGNFADEHALGHVVSNDSGAITERRPRHSSRAGRRLLQLCPVPGRSISERSIFNGGSGNSSSKFVLRPTVGARRDRQSSRVSGSRASTSICVVDDSANEVQVFDDDGVRGLNGDDALTFPNFSPGSAWPCGGCFE